MCFRYLYHYYCKSLRGWKEKEDPVGGGEDLELLLSRSDRRMVASSPQIVQPHFILDQETPRRERKYDIKTEEEAVSDICVTVNGVEMHVSNPDPSMLLSTWLRETLGLRGTKLGCEEGGCGACSIILQAPSTASPVAVNACLRPLCLCDGCSITTVEGIGSIRSGLSKEQARCYS